MTRDDVAKGEHEEMKRKGPRTEPWGTRHETGALWDSEVCFSLRVQDW